MPRSFALIDKNMFLLVSNSHQFVFTFFRKLLLLLLILKDKLPGKPGKQSSLDN